jgi:hypothetical protein
MDVIDTAVKNIKNMELRFMLFSNFNPIIFLKKELFAVNVKNTQKNKTRVSLFISMDFNLFFAEFKKTFI